MKKYIVIIPTYNESKTIELITKSLKSINVDKATKTAKKATKTASEKMRRKNNGSK